MIVTATDGASDGTGAHLGAVVVCSSRDDRRRLERVLESDDGLALVSSSFVRAGVNDPVQVEAKFDRAMDRCAELGVDADRIEELHLAARSLGVDELALFAEVIRRAMRGTPFIVGIRGIPEPSNALVTLVEEMVGGRLAILDDVSLIGRTRFGRAPSAGLRLPSDRELFDVIRTPNVSLEASWNTWLGRWGIDDQRGFSSISPILQERLAALGIVNAETNRLRGLGRRALYLNSILRADVELVISSLELIGISAWFGGNFIDTLSAERCQVLRSVERVTITVAPQDAERAVAALRSFCTISGVHPRFDGGSVRRSSHVVLVSERRCRFRLQWRWLPARGSRLVGLDETEPERLTIGDRDFIVMSPDSRLIHLWATLDERRPRRILAAILESNEIIDRHRATLDWEWITDSCRRLLLDERIRTLAPLMPGAVIGG